MKTSLIVVLGLIGVAAVGAFGYVLFSDSSSSSALSGVRQEQVPEAVAVVEEPVVGEGSLLSLLTQAVPLECTITYRDPEGTDVTGTYFVAGGKVRGDFIVKVQGTDSVSSMIIADETFYSWSEIEGETYGMKARLSAVTEVTDDSSPDVNTPVPLDTNVRYDCRPWILVDGSVFVPPGDVLFQDFSALMNRGMETPTSFTTPSTDQCALCAMVPAGEGQDECRRTFACGE